MAEFAQSDVTRCEEAFDLWMERAHRAKARGNEIRAEQLQRAANGYRELGRRIAEAIKDDESPDPAKMWAGPLGQEAIAAYAVVPADAAGQWTSQHHYVPGDVVTDNTGYSYPVGTVLRMDDDGIFRVVTLGDGADPL